MKVLLYWWQIGIAIASAIALYTNSTVAQITPDATLPNNSNVTNEGKTFNITGGSTAGSNLFHSFKDFSIPTGSSAFFNNAINIQNIISRVTGKSISNIDGLIKANGGANLFLINPNGIIFGENAKLEIGGSFIGSTANAIQFGNLGTFSATKPEAPTPLLTINPSALLFSQVQASKIESNSVAPSGNNPSNPFTAKGLRVPDGKSLLLVGGDVSINNGGLYAFGGRVELGGLADTGTVALNKDGNNFSLSFPEEVNKSDVSFTNGAGVDVATGGSGGSIVVNARNLEASGESFLQAGIKQRLGSVNTQAGNITINATESINLKSGSYIGNFVQPQAIGKGGDINIATGSLFLSDGSQVGTGTSGQGDAGSVNINARSTVSFDGVSEDGYFASGVINQIYNNASGYGGDINITTGSLSLTNGARLNSSTFGKGNAGNVSILARDFVLIDGLGAGGTKNSAITSAVGTQEAQGNGGDININTGTFSLTNGAQILNYTFGKGNAGNVTIQARDAVSLNGNFKRVSSTVATGVGSTAFGKGGDINITTASLSLQNGTQLLASTQGIGNAGNVKINARDYVLINGVSNYGVSSAISGSVDTPETIGNGGSIDISTRALLVTNGAYMMTNTKGRGDGGSITVNANILEAFNGGKLITDSRSNGKAGNIILNVTDKITFSGSEPNYNTRLALFGKDVFGLTDPTSGAFASTVENSTGQGGDITITTRQLDVQDSAKLTVNSAGSGNAGNVNIFARSIRLHNNSILSANTRSTNTNPKRPQAAINLQVKDLLLLSHGSNITTNAIGTNVIGGDININTDVLAAVQNSHIQANSNDFQGGRVKIDAQGVVLSSDSTITATGLTPQLNGTVQINTPDVDPSRGLVPLTVYVVDVAGLVDNNICARTAKSSFTYTGRGGLPPSPNNKLNTDVVWEDWQLTTVPTQTEKEGIRGEGGENNSSRSNQIVEAQGLIINQNGEVILTTDAQKATPYKLGTSLPACQAPIVK